MRILLIAYYYPPVRGGGSRRPALWRRALEGLGHQVSVLTHTYGPTRLDGPIFRLHDPSHNRAREGGRWLQWAALRAVVELRNRRGDPRSIYWWWRRAAERAMPVVLARSRPEVVVATYSPVESLELGLAAAGAAGVPLVADFRDGLLCEPIEARRLAAYPAVREHYRRLEERVAASAAAITVALPRLAEDFAERHGVQRVLALPNAFDPAEHAAAPAVELAADRFHVVHTGSFAASDAGCDIAPFVRAVAGWAAANPEIGRRLLLHQIGRLTRRERRLLGGLLRSGLAVDHGEVDRASCLGYQRRADLGLLITSLDRPGVTPGKLFEYLGAGCPVLALTHRSFAAEIVRRTGVGWVVHPADEVAIGAALAHAMAPATRGRLRPDADEVAAYSAARQAARLDELLRGLVGP